MMFMISAWLCSLIGHTYSRRKALKMASRFYRIAKKYQGGAGAAPREEVHER